MKNELLINKARSKRRFTLAIILISWCYMLQPTYTLADPERHPCNVTPATHDQWYDLSHAFLSRKFCEPAIAFDSFFGDDRSLEEDDSRTYARWRNDFVWNESDRIAFHTQVKAKVRLPNLNKRFKLFIASEHDDDFDSPIDGNTTEQGSTQNEEDHDLSDSTLGLQYDIKSKARYSTSFRIGLKTRFPIQPHSSFRYRFTKPLSNDYLFRFTETLFWRKWEGFGETSRFDLEKLVSPSTLSRTSLSKTFSETSSGIDWDASTGIFYRVSDRAGLSLDLVTSGSTRPNSVITNYGIVMKYRRNIFRKWFFFEVIPKLNWPRDENDHYGGRTSLLVRFEVQFWEN